MFKEFLGIAKGVLQDPITQNAIEVVPSAKQVNNALYNDTSIGFKSNNSKAVKTNTNTSNTNTSYNDITSNTNTSYNDMASNTNTSNNDIGKNVPCGLCGNSFIKKNSIHKFCSSSCRVQSWCNTNNKQKKVNGILYKPYTV